MDPQLSALAHAHGVATWYENADRHRVEVADDVVRAVLAELEVDPDAPAAPRKVIGGPLVVREGERVDGEVILETGERAAGDLPLGYHRLAGAEGADGRELIVTPRRLPPVTPAWGWMLQLYALHSPGSWGIGDLADLREFALGSAGLGAGVILVNPVQAITPARPVQRSPYSPSSRRFANPLYLRVTDTEAFRRADSRTRATVERLAPPPGAELIDYDAVWTAKLTALEHLWAGGNGQAVPDDLRDFATFCALAERHGADWRTWPAGLRRPDGPDVADARRQLPARISFHAWLQRLCQRQLADARTASDVRIVHDLPVGVDPAGADAWALQDVLASDVTVGAPPDAFSQQGQDWNLPPWRPDRLAAQGYRPFRDVIRSVLAHADGIRVDHIAGLWRLWWIPPGRPASEGTYVHYDADAHARHPRPRGAPGRRDRGRRGPRHGPRRGHRLPARPRHAQLVGPVLRAGRPGRPAQPLLPPERWPVDAMASISTHDLPTTVGFLRAENVRVRADLGLLDRPGRRVRAGRGGAGRDCSPHSTSTVCCRPTRARRTWWSPCTHCSPDRRAGCC